MSSISGTSGTQGIFQYLQSLSGSQATSQAAATTTQAISGGHHRPGGGKGGDSSGFFSQIQSAVTAALQSAQSSGSTTNPNTVIQDAIASIFKNQQNVTGSSANSTGTTATATDPDGDGDTDAPGVTDSDSSTAKSAFAQLLQANGVNPEQFHQDFLSAIQSAQSGGSASASSVFSGFPAGSVIDTLA